MAEYVRFDIYIPVVYQIPVADPVTGQTYLEDKFLDRGLVKRFIKACYKNFQGVTQANPDAPHAYRGVWQDQGGSSVETDELTIIFVLVKAHHSRQALRFFENWKKALEQRTNQQVILITYYTVHTIGDFF